jgi:hypothetical protein
MSLTNKIDQHITIIENHVTIIQPEKKKSLLKDLEVDCFQTIIDFLSVSESVIFLCNISKSLKQLNSIVSFSDFSEVERKRFLSKTLNKRVFKSSILHFGFLDNYRLSCGKIDLLICFFNQLHTSFNIKNETYEVKILSANKDFMLSDVKNSFSQTGKVSPKNLRVGEYNICTYICWICK